MPGSRIIGDHVGEAFARRRIAEHVVFEKNSHLAMVEEPDWYRRVLESFLERVEAT